MRRLVGRRRSGRHDVRELEGEDVQDVALRMVELDLDRPVRVVRDDSGDVALLRGRIAVVTTHARDRREETDARRVHLERTLDAVLEVARLERLPVRVLQVRPERELQVLTVGRDLGHALSQVRHELRARRSRLVLVAEQSAPDVVVDLVRGDGVVQRRVHVVRCIPDDFQNWIRLAAVAPTGVAVVAARGLVAATAAAGEEGKSRKKREDADEAGQPRSLCH